MRLRPFAVLALTVLGMAILQISPSAASAYAKYDGIDGEALADSANPGLGINLGDPARDFAEVLLDGDQRGAITFHRQMDGASPLLARWAQQDQQFRTLRIYVPDFNQGHYREYELINARVTGYVAPDVAAAATQTTEQVLVYYDRFRLVLGDQASARNED